jgi:hypothetical protein
VVSRISVEVKGDATWMGSLVARAVIKRNKVLGLQRPTILPLGRSRPRRSAYFSNLEIGIDEGWPA